MNAHTNTRIARYFTLPIISAGIIAGALGFAGAASAGTYSQDTTPRPGIVATPTVTAHPAPEASGHHHGIPHLQHLQPSYQP